MIDSIVSTIMTFPIYLGTAFIVVVLILALIAMIHYICTNDSIMIKLVITFFDPDSSAWNSMMLSTGIMFLVKLFAVIGVITFSTANIFVGIASICTVWYTIYIVDIWIDMLHSWRRELDVRKLK